MWPRETTARSGDIGAGSDRHRHSQSLRVLQRSTAVCAEAKNTGSLAARMGGCGPGSQPIRDTNAICGPDGQVLVSDVAACDVRSGDIAQRFGWPRPEDSLGALRAAAPGEEGKAEAAKAESVTALHIGETQWIQVE